MGVGMFADRVALGVGVAVGSVVTADFAVTCRGRFTRPCARACFSRSSREGGTATWCDAAAEDEIRCA
jgi:hypothetical protein